jgi:hypothetical protein
MNCARWVVALIVVAILATAAAAQETDPFSAKVTVDATADSAAKARDIARADGQRRALNIIAEHLAAGGAPPKVPKLDDKAITDLVANFEVSNEKMSAVHYSAEYIFHFRPGETRKLLGNPGPAANAKPGDATANPAGGAVAAAASPPAKATLVVPLYQADGPVRLWEEPNPWREAWDQHPPATGALHLVVPLGDAGDVAAIDADKARAGDAAAITAIARHNGADEVLVPQASLQGPADKPTGIDLNVRRYRGGQLVDTHTETLVAKPGEGGDALLTRAVAAIGAGVAGGWKKEAGPRLEQEGSLTAVLPISGLEDWVTARDRIAAMPVVKKVNLVALSLQEATIEISYTGSVDQLKTALSSLGLTLERGDAAWRLTRAEPGPRQ